MRTLALISILCLAPLSRASYELVLVPDQGSASVSARVHRFDGITGAYLGSFGAGRLSTPNGIAVDADRGIAYVVDASVGLTRWNYSTGEYMGIATTSTAFGYPDVSIASDGNVYGLLGASVYRFDPATNAVTSVSVSGASTLASMAILSPTEAIAADYNLNKYFRFNPRTGAILSTVTGTILADNSYSQGAFFRSSSGSPYAVRAAYNSATGDMYVDSFNSTYTTVTTLNLSSTNVKSASGVAAAHYGFYATGQLKSNTAVGTVSYFNENRREGLTFGSGQIIKPYGLACVNAPEPSTWAALGLGALVLMRRRKR